MDALRRGVLAVALLLGCHAADAFGPKTHLWIGSEVLRDLRDDCSVELASKRYPVARDLCQAITSNPESFHAGVLGPDIYPDLLAGQSTVHAGVKDGWESADFIEHVVASATTPPSRAYAAGYLVHAAGDVFGHSYVNGYAGDVWNMGGERTVELRHLVIERYIDAHLPPMPPDTTTFHAPAEFVRDTLVHNARTRAQYRIAASHLAAMTSVKAAVDDIATRADAVTGEVSELLARSVESAVTLAAQLVDGEAALALASAALEAPKAAAAAQHDVLDRAKNAFDDAAGALARHENALATLATQAQAQHQASADANASARQAKSAAEQIRARLSELETKIRSVPPKIVVSVCRNVTEPFCETLCPEDSSNPLCVVCKVPREICVASERVNDEYQALDDEITNAKQRLGELESAAAQDSAKADAAAASADALRREQAAETEAGTAIAAEEIAAESAYHAADEQYESIAGRVASLQRRADALRARTEETRKKIVDARALADQLRAFAAQLNLLSQLFHNWQAGIDQAGSAFIAVSDRIGVGMLVGRRHLFSEYGRWLACEGATYLAEPYQLADVACSTETGLQRLQALLHDTANAVLPEPLKGLHVQLDDLRLRMETELRGALTVATRELVRFVSDRTTADFVELLMNPRNVTRERLDEVLATAGEGGEQEILVFENGADLVDRDIGLADGTLDPKRFAALASAVTLAKLALLDQTQTRELARDIGGAEALAAYDAGRFDVGRSIVLTAVRSLDGNEQWQPYGLLYPRSSGAGAPADASERHYGFGPRDARRHGLPLFVDPVLRERVFLRLFRGQIHGEVAKRPEMAPGRYAFPICDGNPFPLTFLPDGAPASGDDRCATMRTEAVAQ